jgi:hypothetical protein
VRKKILNPPHLLLPFTGYLREDGGEEKNTKSSSPLHPSPEYWRGEKLQML